MLQNLWQSFVARSFSGFGRGLKGQHRRSSPRPILRTEALEQRLVLSSFSVINTNDSGAGSFRQAILDANANAGSDTIAFAIPGTGLHTIQTLSAMPTISGSVVIDGYSQAGSSANTLSMGNNAVLTIELNGTSAGAASTGLLITASNSTVRGLVINRFGSRGIEITGAAAINNAVTGNFIGTNATGTAALGNTSDGVRIVNAATANWVGTNGDGLNDLAERNVISGSVSGNGVVIGDNGTQNNVVAGNSIGTNAAGTAALGNTQGILVTGGAHNNRVGTNGDGTSDAAERNIVAGNRQDGIFLTLVNQTVVAGNVLGLAADGATILANGFRGIEIRSGASNRVGTDGNGVGDIDERNIISGNSREGILIYTADGTNVIGTQNLVAGNYIGTDVTGTLDRGNKGVGVSFIFNATNNTVGGTTSALRNVISGNDSDGVSISTSTGNTVVGNYIGTNAAGTADLGNSGRGVTIAGASSNNTIGGTTAAARNIISGNDIDGAYITGNSATGNFVQGNYIGTDVTGQFDLGNDVFGVRLENSSGNTVGGTTAGAGNLISGNSGSNKSDGAGLAIIASTGNTAANNLVQGNLIGTNATGTAALGNSNRGGVSLENASNNTIGGTTAAARNIISGNNALTSGTPVSGHGVSVGGTNNSVIGNYIGTDITGTVDLGNVQDGILVTGNNNTIGGTTAGAGNVISGNDFLGIALSGGTGTVIVGNFIGTNAAGTGDLGNTSNGVRITSSSGNTIGGTTASARNIISGNDAAGIQITGATAKNNFVTGNYIGTDVTGSVDLGNTTDGILVTSGANNNTIGGTAAGAGNVISGNNRDGIEISVSTTTTTLVVGNLIGTTAAGTGDLGNSVNGIRIDFASNNTIGGTAAGAGNIISGNDAAGVAITGSSAVGNVVRGNSLFANSGLAIDLDATGITPNDLADGDTGPNLKQNFPGIASAQTGATTTVSGTLNSTANTSFTLDFYASAVADPSGHGEGERYLGSATIVTDGSGNANFAVVLASVTTATESISVTATAPNGNTSEFAGHLPIANAGGPYVAPEGGSVQLNGLLSNDPDTSNSLTYQWDLDGDNVFGETGAGATRGNETGTTPTFSAVGLDGLSVVSVTLRVTDTSGLRDDDTVNITISNVSPTANADAGATNEDTVLTVAAPGVLTNDTDPAGASDQLTVTGFAASSAKGASVVVNSNGSYSYDPRTSAILQSLAVGQLTADTFTYDIDDGDGGSSNATVTITVSGVNDVPTIASSHSTVTVNEGTIAANSGTFADVDSTNSVTLLATVGTVTWAGTNSGTWHWSFNTNDGPDQTQTVTITATDNDGAVTTTTFELVVTNVAPSVAADSASVTVNEGSTATTSGTWSDPGLDVVTLAASIGSVMKNADGTWNWSFNTNDGPDQTQAVTITATDSDGAVTTTAFDLVVTNVAPSVSVTSASVTVGEGSTATNSGVWSDPGLDVVTLAASIGSVTKNADGTWNWSFNTNDGPDQTQVITITATDSDGATTATTFALGVSNVAPSVSVASASVTVNEGSTATNTGVWSDLGFDVVALAASIGSVTKNADGTWNWSFSATDGPDQSQTVTITATDSDGAATATTFALGVNNVAPTATNNAYAANQGSAVSGNVISDALADSDPAGANDPLTITSYTQPANGSVTVSANGYFTYTPAATFSGTNSFTYSISDGDGGSATATVTITVSPPAAGSVTTVIDTCEGGTAVLINGTSIGDQIVVELGVTSAALRITINGTITTVATPSGRIIVLGDAGDDNIQIAGSVMNTVWAFGDAGHDRIFGGGGASLLFGGDGNDQLTGGSGRDILIGGQGADKLVGNSGDDVLIAGFTTKDNRAISGVEEFWCHVMAEWNSTNSFADRLANLRAASSQSGNAHNGMSYLLPVVLDDTSADEIDMLQGSSGNDWFLFRTGEDKVVGQLEAVN